MKSFVNDLLDNQQIGRRRHSDSSRERLAGNLSREKTNRKRNSGGSVFGQTAYRPARVVSLSRENSRLIDDIPQNPSRNNGFGFFSGLGESRASGSGKRSRPSRVRESGSPRDFFQGFFGGSDDAAPERFSRRKSYKKQSFSLLSVPAIPFAALFIFALGVFFVIYNQAGSFDWTGREVVTTEKDEGSQYNLALYAGVTPPAEKPVSAAPQDAQPLVRVSAFAPQAGLEGEAIPLDLMETFAWQTYTVKRGDSVSKIAAAHSVSMDAIIASNGISNARSLKAGEQLRVPNMDGIPYLVKNGDSLSGISKAMGVPVEAILDANDLQSDTIHAGMSLFVPGARMSRNDLKMALGELFIYPLKGAKLSSPFGWRNDPISGVRRHHAAVDLSAPQGTPIHAVMDGKVSSLGYNGTYGNFIIVTHGDGFQTMYAHLYTFSVRNGDNVKQGVQIGTVGSTGYSTGPHLHFSVFKNNRAVNPLDFLNPRS